MKIEISSHNYSQVMDPTPEVYSLLSYTTKSYNRRTKRWKAVHHSLIDNRGMVLTGLVPYIQEHVPNVDIVDNRVFSNVEYHDPPLSVSLREYQIAYVLQALQERRMVIHASTGAGKTVIMAAIIGILNLPTLIIAPNLTVAAQLETELCALLGIPNRQRIFYIGIARNLHGYLRHELQEFPLLLVDDCHFCPAAQCQDVILRQNAPYRFGFTGTPTGRSDGQDLVIQGLLGRVVKLIETEELVSEGYIAPTTATFQYGNWDGDYALMEELLIVNNTKRNGLIIKIVKQYQHEGSVVLVICRRLEHGRLLQSQIPRSVFIHGDTSAEEREVIRQQAKEGKLRVLIASNVFATGLDIPNIEVGVNAAGGKAEILTAQKLGRVMRPWHEVCKKWIDLYDNYHPTLEDHSRERVQVYHKSGVKIELIGFPAGKQHHIETELLSESKFKKLS